MPAAVAKGESNDIQLLVLNGVEISLSVLDVQSDLSRAMPIELCLVVIENQQVQEWLEEQRQKIAQLLRQIGDELDPQSRRSAEAFAYEGRTPANDDGLRREAQGSENATAVATGRSLSNASTIRRIPVQGPMSPEEAEERRRKGREYLARRNQQLYEYHQRRKAAEDAGEPTPPTPTFDELVDADGNLILSPASSEKRELPVPPVVDPLPAPILAEMKEVERQLSQPVMLGESSSMGTNGWQSGSAFANPFGDEYALERSITPKPPVPPKIELDSVPSPPISVPGSSDATAALPLPVQEEHISTEGLSYEEQLAIAMSLSEQESSASSATVRQQRSEEEDDRDLRAAIAASLQDMDHQQASHAIACAEKTMPRAATADVQPLVDLSTSAHSAAPPPAPYGEWRSMFAPRPLPERELVPASGAQSVSSDELYRLTPELARARPARPELTQALLAHHNAQQAQSSATQSFASGSFLPFDPARDDVNVEKEETERATQDVAMDSSFYSAPSEVSVPPSTHTLGRETTPQQLIDLSEEVPPEGMRTPTSRTVSSFAFQTDSEDSETFASMSQPATRPQSRAARSEMSAVEVIDLVEDTDVDMLSEEGDGVATPDSWTEVGSNDGDSEAEAHSSPQQRSLE